MDCEVALIHRSAMDFLLQNKQDILDLDSTSPTDRTIHIMQATAIRSLYVNNKNNWPGAEENAMYILSKIQPELEQAQESDILTLIQDIYQYHGWQTFHENEAKYGFSQCLEVLKPEREDCGALQNYLLLASLYSYGSKVCETLTSKLLSMGANPETISIVLIVDNNDFSAERTFYYQQPIFTLWYKTLGRFENAFDDVAHSLFHSGEILNQRFLTTYPCYKHLLVADALRPVHFNIYLGMSGFLFDTNTAGLLLHYLRGSNLPEGQKIKRISEFGLEERKPYLEVLLYFCRNKETVYQVNADDSKALQPYLHDPSPKDQEICQLLKGKEVEDFVQWLTDKGYSFVEQSEVDILKRQDATIYEMAECYARLNAKYGKRKHMHRKE